VAIEVFVKHLGMRPKEAYMVASLTLNAGMTAGLNAAGLPSGPGWKDILNRNTTADNPGSGAQPAAAYTSQINTDTPQLAMNEYQEVAEGTWVVKINDEANPVAVASDFTAKAAGLELRITTTGIGGALGGGRGAQLGYEIGDSLSNLATGQESGLPFVPIDPIAFPPDAW
jgi:hypothetical protein